MKHGIAKNGKEKFSPIGECNKSKAGRMPDNQLPHPALADNVRIDYSKRSRKTVMSYRINLLLSLIATLGTCISSATGQPARQLADFGGSDTWLSSFAPTAPGPLPARELYFVTLNGIGYFTALDDAHGAEIWRTDGTAEGTYLFQDLKPGREDGLPRQFVLTDNLFYFTAENTPYGRRLFRSDGTFAGTFPVRDDMPLGTPSVSDRNILAVEGDRIYFSSAFMRNGVSSGLELWTTDGSRAGTRLVKEIGYGATSGVYYPDRLRAAGIMLNGKLLFSGQRNTTEGFQLWESDGTPSGTRLLKHLAQAKGYSYPHATYPLDFVKAGSIVFFNAFTDNEGSEWWRTDGTADGTFMLPDFTPHMSSYGGVGLSTVTGSAYAASIGQNLIYAALSSRTVGSSYELSQNIACSDGTAEGTKILRERLKMLDRPVVGQGKVWFLAEDQAPDAAVEQRVGIWVADSNECRFISASAINTRLVAAGNLIYGQNPNLGLQSIDAQTEQVLYGKAVWNTSNNTWSVPSPLLEATTGEPMHFSAFGSQLFFTYFTNLNGREPWLTDGTPAGTRLLKDINQTPRSGIPSGYFEMFLSAGDETYFPTYSSGFGLYDLMRYSPVDETVESVGGLKIPALTIDEGNWGAEVNGSIVFTAYASSEAQSRSLYIIRDGEANPVTLSAGTSGQYPAGFVRSGSYVFFTALDRHEDGSSDLELWRTEGTPSTTIKLRTFDDPRHMLSASLSLATAAGGKLFFWIRKTFDTMPYEQKRLWVSDGTVEGTTEVEDTQFTTSPASMYPFGDGVVFMLGDGFWFTDGNPAKSTRFISGSGIGVHGAFEFQNQIWFVLRTSLQNLGLWRSDGTVAGTRSVTNIVDNISSAQIFKGNAYFGTGYELFVVRNNSNTAERMFPPDFPVYTGFWNLTATEGALYFSGYDLTHGTELWRTDGTVAGTTLVQDINPRLASSSPSHVRQIGTNIFFTAEDNRGTDPWIMPASAALPPKVSNPDFLGAVTGTPYSFQPLVISGLVKKWLCSGLPPGLDCDPATGLIFGVPQMNGDFSVLLHAYNDSGTAASSFTLRVADPDYARVVLAPAVTPGKLSLSLSAIAGLRYQILTSTDLINWETLVLDADAELSIPELENEGGKRFFKVLTLESAP